MLDESAIRYPHSSISVLMSDFEEEVWCDGFMRLSEEMKRIWRISNTFLHVFEKSDDHADDPFWFAREEE